MRSPKNTGSMSRYLEKDRNKNNLGEMDWVILNICDVSQLEENSCWESELKVKVLGILPLSDVYLIP